MKCIFRIGVLFIGIACYAQDVHYKLISTSEGLQSNTVYNITQDAEGRIVIGHEEGISIYNGIGIRHLKHPEISKPTDNFTPLLEGGFVARNFQGNIIHVLNDTVTEILIKNKLTSGFPTFMRWEDQVIGFHDTLLFELKKNNYAAINLEGLHTPAKIRSATILGDFLFLVVIDKASYAKLLLYDLKKRKVKFINELNTLDNYCLYQVCNQVLLFDKTNLSYRIVKPDGELSSVRKFDKLDSVSKITFVKSDELGNILIGTFDGILIYDSEFNFKSHYLRGFQVSSFYHDIEGNYWISTLQNGICLVPTLETYLIKSEDLPGKNVKFSKTFLLPNGKLLAGTFDGRLFVFGLDRQVESIIDLGYKAEVQSIFYDSVKNQILLYCHSLITIDPGTWKLLRNDKSIVTKCMALRNDNLVIGSSIGVVVNGNKRIVDSLWVRNLFFVEDNKLILETAKGMKLLSLGEVKIENLYPDLDGVPNDLVKLKGTFYFRFENIIYSLTEDLKNVEVYRSKTPLKKLFSDGERLWVFTSDVKLCSILDENKYCVNESKGMALREVQDVFWHLNTLVLVSNSGIQYIEEIPAENKLKPRLILSDLSGTYTLQETSFITKFENNKLVLALELLPNIRSLGKGKVYYRIPEIDSNWSLIQSDGTYFHLELNRLHRGTYKLELMGKNENSVRSELMSLNLIVLPPFYLTSWFIVLMILLLLALGFGVFKFALSINHKKNLAKIEKERLKRKAVHAELTAIRSQMNPHFVFNSLTSIQSMILNDQSKEAYTNLSTFSKLLRQALHYSGQEMILLKEELEFIQNYVKLELMRSNNGFDFSLRLSEEFLTENHYIPSLILQPYVENAIRHGLQHKEGYKKLEINIQRIENGFRVTITDNGIGRMKSDDINQRTRKNHISFASKAILERIQILNQSGRTGVKIDIIDLEEGTSVNIDVIDKSNL